MYKVPLPAAILLVSGVALPARNPPGKPAEEVIAQFVQAVGGAAAVDRIETREIHANRHHGPKLTYFWQKPNSVLLIEGKKRIGYDGRSGWMLSQKKRVSRLPKGSQQPLEMDANPLRYANLKQLYPEVKSAVPETLEDRRMDVLVSPNDLGSTKFYFDDSTHLLARVEETGEVSAYFKNVTDFMDYQEIDGIKLPFRIVHNSTEPGAKTEDLRISKVIQNAPLKPGLFSKPAGGGVVLGGKR